VKRAAFFIGTFSLSEVITHLSSLQSSRWKARRCLAEQVPKLFTGCRCYNMFSFIH